MKGFQSQHGFALPSVLITSTVMLMVLMSALATVSSVRAGLDQQYYSQLMREAAEAGTARARQCFADGGYASTWTSPLTPATDCMGNIVPGQSVFVLDGLQIKTSFQVPVSASTNNTLFDVTSTLSRYRMSGSVLQTSLYVSKADIGGTIFGSRVAYGYQTFNSANFATISYRGEVFTLGSNRFGQLGNGSGSIGSYSAVPVRFQLPVGAGRAVELFLNASGAGSNIFALDNNGDVYGAGNNTNGTLGNPSAPLGNVGVPVRYQLPSGVTVRAVSNRGDQGGTYVLGSDNKLYVAGNCQAGLGIGYGCSGSQVVNTPTPVLLPTPNLSDLNTLPTTKMSNGTKASAVVMQGGAVYTWGSAFSGVIGQPLTPINCGGGYTCHNSNYITPVRVPGFGNTGEPKVINVVGDDNTLFILTDDGDVYTVGMNDYGQAGHGNGMLLNGIWPGHCAAVQNVNGVEDGTSIYPTACDGTKSNQQWRYDMSNKTMSITTLGVTKCLDGSNVNAVMTLPCNGSVNQQWEWVIGPLTHYLRNVGQNLYMGMQWSYAWTNGLDVRQFPYNMKDCGPNPAAPNDCRPDAIQTLMSPTVTKMTNFTSPVVKAMAIQSTMIVMLQNGEVWGMGNGSNGEFGDGATSSIPFSYQKRRFILPSGVKAVDFSMTFVNDIWKAYNNTMVVGDDGKVYVSGGGQFGQLGQGVSSYSQTYTPIPMKVLGETPTSPKALRVVIGYGTAVVVGNDGKLYTVGFNAYGQLGDGTTANNGTPRANKFTNPGGLVLF